MEPQTVMYYERLPHIQMEYKVDHSTMNIDQQHFHLKQEEIKQSPIICYIFINFTNIYPLPGFNPINNNNNDDDPTNADQFQRLSSHLGILILASCHLEHIKDVMICEYLSSLGVDDHCYHHLLITTIKKEISNALSDEDYLRTFLSGKTRKELKISANFVRVHEEFFDDGSECRLVPAASSVVSSLEKVKVEGLDESTRKDNCCICFERIDMKEFVTKLSCQHVFHNDCIAQWLESSHLCPLCRFELPTKMSD